MSSYSFMSGSAIDSAMFSVTSDGAMRSLYHNKNGFLSFTAVSVKLLKQASTVNFSFAAGIVNIFLKFGFDTPSGQISSRPVLSAKSAEFRAPALFFV